MLPTEHLSDSAATEGRIKRKGAKALRTEPKPHHGFPRAAPPQPKAGLNAKTQRRQGLNPNLTTDSNTDGTDEKFGAQGLIRDISDIRGGRDRKVPTKHESHENPGLSLIEGGALRAMFSCAGRRRFCSRTIAAISGFAESGLSASARALPPAQGESLQVLGCSRAGTRPRIGQFCRPVQRRVCASGPAYRRYPAR
jgi:hypothetical protein